MADDLPAEDYYSNEAATFGDRVTAAREAVGLSQEELAKKLGVKLKTVHGWEDDVSEPRANKLQMMAGLLNVSMMWLLNGEGDGVEPVDEPLDADVQSILLEMRQTRAEMHNLTERLGRLEKRLQLSLRGT
jgi:transcriptional regulator with XRE-family HTH domain